MFFMDHGATGPTTVLLQGSCLCAMAQDWCEQDLQSLFLLNKCTQRKALYFSTLLLPKNQSSWPQAFTHFLRTLAGLCRGHSNQRPGQLQKSTIIGQLPLSWLLLRNKWLA